jgi:plasmid stabilization system protein ParE
MEERAMPRGDKSSYSSKQRRQARKIETGYKRRGVSGREAERRAWATVNKATGGGRRSGSGKGKATNKSPMRKGGRIGGSSQSSAERSRAAKKGWETRRKNAGKATT